jgi:hypothetical protein
MSTIPVIAFLGPSGAGKSAIVGSLIANATAYIQGAPLDLLPYVHSVISSIRPN